MPKGNPAGYLPQKPMKPMMDKKAMKAKMKGMVKKPNPFAKVAAAAGVKK